MDMPHDTPSPVISDIKNFDADSGSVLERLIFKNRPIILALCALLTVLLGLQATRITVNANFNKMIPVHQHFIVNYLSHYEDLQFQGNAIHIAVQANDGGIIDAHYLEVLKHINDDVFLLPGVNRAYMTSLWTPSTRWLAVTPDGLQGGPVIAQTYDGSAAQLDLVRQNIEKTGKVGELVATDFSSSMIYVPLLDTDAAGPALNYGQLARRYFTVRKKVALF